MTAPPEGATYFDMSTMTCSPCQSGSVNNCRTNPEGQVDENPYEWIFASTRSVPVAAGVSDCCTTVADPTSGMYNTTCDTTKGCGWVAGPYLTDEITCKFTTEDAKYASFEECQTANPAPTTTTDPGGDWFPPCSDEVVTDCYFPDVDACMPAVFGQQRRQALAAAAARMELTPTCTTYVCNAPSTLDSTGRLSFAADACHCVHYA